MALKDWKKIGREFRLKGATTRKIIVDKLNKPLLTGEKYYIQGENTQEVFRVKFYKSYSQALKFAKSYMRTH